MSQTKQLQVWADSFKEGEWFLINLAQNYYKNSFDVKYKFNFQPIITFYQDGGILFEAIVFAPYRNWSPIPSPVRKILEYGKPDVILYDPDVNQVFFAVEETAAVPTGNQSLQRLERVCFAAEQGIPFVYLVSEYGLHIDGHVRRSSIWPSYLALKLTSQYQVISLTLLYGDAQHPEDYNIGTGVHDLAEISDVIIKEWLGESVEERKRMLLKKIIRKMCDFILDQYWEISPHLPGRNLLSKDEFHEALVQRVIP